MKTRNLLVRLNQEEHSHGVAFLAAAIENAGLPPKHVVRRFHDAIAKPNDAGAMTGTPFEIVEESAPLTTGDEKPAASPPDEDVAVPAVRAVPDDAAVPTRATPRKAGS